MTTIHSRVLGEDIEINTQRPGPNAYTANEIAWLKYLGAEGQAIRDIHAIRKAFDGEIVGKGKRR